MAAARRIGAWDGKVQQVVVHGKPVDVFLKTITVNGMGIESLSEIEGLDAIEDVVHLDLRNNRLHRLDLDGHDNLRGVAWLELAGNGIEVMPHLDRLTKLTELNLAGNKIRRIEHLYGLERLGKLALSDNQIEAVEGLDRLASLEDLDLSRNHLTRISGLDSLKALRFLDLGGNPITRIEGLSKLNNLELLGIEGITLPWDVLVIELGGFVDDQGHVDGQLAVQYCRDHEL